MIAQYQRAYFENGAIPATITFITASTFEKYDKTRKELENKLKGAHNRNKTVYAWRQFDNDTGQSVDQVEVKTIQGNNSTLAIKEIVEIVNDRLNKSIGVSNFILGDDSSAKYDNAELSDHQFTKRRVYPALMSFWNQFQHELERILEGLGYGISFDLEIPELTERTKAKAEIGRIRSEALVNLISAGASGASAVEALGLPKDWSGAANDIYAKSLLGQLNAPVAIDYEKPKAIESTVDKKGGESEPTDPLENLETHDLIHGHNCECHKSLDALPEMTPDERKLYEKLIELARDIMQRNGEQYDKILGEMIDILVEDANKGGEEGAKALSLLAEDDVASEILSTISNGEIHTSEALQNRISSRARLLASGYRDYAQEIVKKTLAGEEYLTANQIRERLEEVMPKERAELIARNETLYSIRSGRLEIDEGLSEKYGLQVKLVWRTSHDKDVCPICAGMEGQTVILGKSFDDTFIAGERLTKEQLRQYKLSADDVLSWEQSSWNDNGRICSGHVNCRCYWDEELV